VVGTSGDAFIYSNGVMQDLTVLAGLTGYAAVDPTGINDAGQIVATVYDHGGTERAFLLTPVSVPEPSTLLLALMAGVAGFVARFGRRRRSDAVRSLAVRSSTVPAKSVPLSGFAFVRCPVRSLQQ
jgi:uncharacterized membrane protein